MRVEYGDCRDCFYWSDEKTSVCTNDKSKWFAKQMQPVMDCPDKVRQFTMDDLIDEAVAEANREQRI